MIIAGTMLLLGFGLFALGVVEPEMYDIGVVIVFIASVGILVRLPDWMRWLLR